MRRKGAEKNSDAPSDDGADSDADGLYDADDDNDRLSDVAEALAGTDPT